MKIFFGSIKRAFEYLSLHLLRRIEIRYRLISFFILLSLLPLLISGYISYVESTRAIEEKTRVFSTEVVKQVSKNVQLRLMHIDRESENLVLSEQVQHALIAITDGNAMAQSAARQDMTRLLLGHYGASDFINQKYLLDKNNRIIDTQVFAQLTRGVARFIDHAPVQHGRSFWGSYDDGMGQQSIGMLRAIISKNSNKPIGNLFLVINPEHFSNIFDDIDLGRDSDIFILDAGTGKVIVWQDNKPLSAVTITASPSLVAKITSSLQRGEQGNFVAFDSNGQNNYLAAYTQIPGTTWFVASTIPKSNLTAEAAAVRNKMVLIGLLCLLLAVFLAYFISHSISAPLNELVRKMREAGNHGEPTYANIGTGSPAKIAGHDELGRLALSFDRMQDAINQKIDEISDINATLEHIVDARTSALASSEQEIRTLIENSPDTVARYDRNCRRLYINPAFVGMSGDAALLLGKTPSEFPGTANSVAYEAKINEVLSSGEDTHFELKWPNKDGREICSHIRLTAERDSSGTVTSVLAVGRDITELNEFRESLRLTNAQLAYTNRELESAQKRLLINEARLQTILDNSPYGIWLVNVDGRYEFVNKTFCNAIGIPEREFVAARQLGDIMDPEDAASCLRSDRECLEQDEPHVSYETLTFVDGKKHVLEITKVKLLDITGEVTGLIGTAIDITEQREHEAELAASRERLRQIERREMLSQERQRLMQDMHDGMGSSLATALRVVEHGKMDSAEVAQVLMGCIDDLKLAIDSMEPVDADLLLLLATLRFRLGPRLESTGITLRWKVENVPALIWLDPKNTLHILRILQEAFTNIIKHTHATEVRVTTGLEGDLVVVTVTDNGKGFSVENALSNGGKGLSNQMRRAEAIGAKVDWVSNETGTRFILRLPVDRRRVPR